MSLLQTIEPYVNNGVVSLKAVKRGNYFLYRVLINKDSAPLLQGLELLNDVKRIKKSEDIEKFLKYNFNDIVDITQLRKNHLTVYKYLSAHGGVKETIEALGFNYTYSSKCLDLPEDSTSRSYHNKLYYQAKKLDMSVVELRKELGLEIEELNKEHIEELRAAGFSYKKIATYLGISKTHVWRLSNG